MFNIVNHQFLHISYINDTTFSVSNKKICEKLQQIFAYFLFSLV